MKLKLDLKDPDGVYDSIQTAARESVDAVSGIAEDEREELISMRRKSIGEAIKPWVEFGEYVTIEIDTEAQTATVKRIS